MYWFSTYVFYARHIIIIDKNYLLFLYNIYNNVQHLKGLIQSGKSLYRKSHLTKREF